MTLSIEEVLQLKKITKEAAPTLQLHFHDACGGQLFFLEGKSEEREEGFRILSAELKKKGLDIIKNEQQPGYFTLEKER